MQTYVNRIIMAGMLLSLMGSTESLLAQSSKNPSVTKDAAMKPVAFSAGEATLSPANSRIEFVGTHVGDDPKPRLGGFKNFKGKIMLGDDNTVVSMELKIDVNSVWTQFDKLTTHLKNADFFETDKYPTAQFVSTKIDVSDSRMLVTGKLTLHGMTKEISFPVRSQLGKDGIVMTSDFQLDRTMFGMDKMTSGVEKTVSLKFVVGQETVTTDSRPGPGTESKQKKGAGKKSPGFTSVTLYAPNMT